MSQPPDVKRWGTLHPFVESGDVLGRKVANTGFLRALLKADPFDEYHFFPQAQGVESLEKQLACLAPEVAERGGFFISPRVGLPEAIAEKSFCVFHLSDFTTDTIPLMRARNAFARNIFPITGVTHSLSYERFMPSFFGLLGPATTERDAVICTSQSAKAMVLATFNQLRSGYNLDEVSFPAPRLPIVPLGIDLDDFPAPADWWRQGSSEPDTQEDAGTSGNSGALMRKKLKIANDETVFLCLARISPYSKMDILPMLSAFKRAEGLGLDLGKSCIVLAGWADDPELPQAFSDFASVLDIRLIPVVRPTDEERRALYAMADCFLSPSDNIQETFGLTILEAGASGLPVIASNFDGYKDLIIPGETGILVPCLGPSATPETNALAGIWMDNQYHLRLAQQTVVDVPAMADAMALMGSNINLRKIMGKAGRHRVSSLYTWDAVIGQYCGLWEFLAAQPVADEAALRKSVHPMQMDFAYSFSRHFSELLDGPTAKKTTVRRTTLGDALYAGQLPPMLYAGMDHMIDPELLRHMLVIARKPVDVVSLLKKMSEAEPARAQSAHERAAFMILWALKHDYLERFKAKKD